MHKGAAEAPGTRSLAADTGITFDILRRTDAGTALGVVNRRGVGKTRHITHRRCGCRTQNEIEKLEVQKVAGEENVADILTKSVNSEVLEKHKTTRRNVDDEFSGQSVSTAKKISALQRALGALRNESGGNRSSSSRTSFQYYHAGRRRVDQDVWCPTHTAGQEARWVQQEGNHQSTKPAKHIRCHRQHFPHQAWLRSSGADAVLREHELVERKALLTFEEQRCELQGGVVRFQMRCTRDGEQAL